MNDYEAKQEARRLRFEELAEKAERDASSSFAASDQITDMIPAGQPILVGHHSEKRHRRDLERSDNKMRKGFELRDKAEYYRNRADAVKNNTSISGDDPEAVRKLEKKLEKLQRKQDTFKAYNKALRIKDIDKSNATLRDLGLDQPTIDKLRSPDFAGRTGIPSYQLTNNNANMRRIKQRIEKLKKKSTTTTAATIGDIEIVLNAEINRIQFIFPGKPSDDVRTTLKKHGFRWSPSNTAWQRHLNGNGQHAARQVLEIITDATDEQIHNVIAIKERD